MPMSLNAKESFAKMNKNCEMYKGIWVQMVELQAVSVKKTAEEIASREAKSSLKKVIKGNNFFLILARIRFTEGRAPADDFLILEKALSD